MQGKALNHLPRSEVDPALRNRSVKRVARFKSPTLVGQRNQLKVKIHTLKSRVLVEQCFAFIAELDRRIAGQ